MGGSGPGPQHLLPEVDEEIESWSQAHGSVIAEHGLAPLLEAARGVVAAADAEIAQLGGFVLAHGDLCSTNILWDGSDEVTGAPRVQYIDFEWAQGDDPARDLANLGGAVHGGPWYVPLTEEQVDEFVRAYVRARGEHGDVPDSASDVASLRHRMRAWTAYERSAMLVHVASRASTRASHRRVLPMLRGTLAEELGVDD
ncbi:phosphotransferase family protein [Brachybacterium sp. Z12]|uniref:phosphotransferase family protein n=1 Tax=Brachybacterium sp. Z12 TaxID=2759167 RepID=UPI00223C1E99|nr:aminoglycoside phosphotransferase family protein [Brachybacterium sp. Z12]